MLLCQARDEGAIREDVGAGEVLMLLCGIAHPTRSFPASIHPSKESVLLCVVFDGLRGPARVTARAD